MSNVSVTNDNSIVASPMNYIGGKAKLLPQILPHFPTDINTFYDVFSGGANVAANLDAGKTLVNDLNHYVVDILREFYATDTDAVLEQVHGYINEYGLSKSNEEGFKSFRADYNANQKPLMLYTLICYSFNYQFRFNNNLQYNNPFGRERSQFSARLEDKLIRFCERLKSKQVVFSCLGFEDFMLNQQYAANDFVYLDPPYLITTGSYNDGNRGFKHWTNAQELLLLGCLDALDRQGVRFALSNVLSHKGRTNDILIEVAKKYRVIELNSNYNNSSYNTKKTGSREILLVNY